MVKRDLVADPRFKDLYDFVFIDEKWFFLYQSLKSIICYPMKKMHIGLVRTRTTFLRSCSCVLLLGQDLGMGHVFLMVELVVFLLFGMSQQ